MPKFKVLITDYVWPTTEPEEAILREEADAAAVVAPDGSEETLISLAGDVDAIMTCFAQVTPNVLKAAPNCVAVGRFGVGVDNIAVDTATELGMAVTYVRNTVWTKYPTTSWRSCSPGTGASRCSTTRSRARDGAASRSRCA